MYGNDWSYARTRLEGTYVRYKGEPVFISLIEGVDRCLIQKLLPNGTYGNEEWVNLDELDLCPFSLGYMNYGKSALYVSRQPMRRDWKQGLRPENIVVTNNRGELVSYKIRSVHFYEMLMGIYPSYEESLKLSKNLSSISWHKHWCVEAGQVIRYRHNEIVGSIVKNVPVLDKSFDYLKESLQETL